MQLKISKLTPKIKYLNSPNLMDDSRAAVKASDFYTFFFFFFRLTSYMKLGHSGM